MKIIASTNLEQGWARPEEPYHPDDINRTEQPPRVISPPDSKAPKGSQFSSRTEATDPLAPSGIDLFDPARLRLTQNFAEGLGVKKALITVPVRKPDRQSFIRVRPDQAYRLEVAMLELKDDREIYLVDPSIASELPGEVNARVLLTTVNRQGVIFLWPARLPNPDGRRDEWSRSALEAAEIATRHWVRVVPNMSLGAYELFEATGNFPEPEWPDLKFTQLLEIAFRDRFIRSLDHPAIKKLKGEL